MIFPFLSKESNSSIYKNSFSTFSVITDFNKQFDGNWKVKDKQAMIQAIKKAHMEKNTLMQRQL